jgi:hypothetical protein
MLYSADYAGVTEGFRLGGTLQLRLDRAVDEQCKGITGSGGLEEVLTVKTGYHIPKHPVFRFRVALDYSEKIKILMLSEVDFVGFFDDSHNVGMVKVTVDVVKADERHKIKGYVLTSEKKKNLASE